MEGGERKRTLGAEIPIAPKGSTKKYVALVDTGSSACIMRNAIARKMGVIKETEDVREWDTQAGVFQTKATSKLSELTFPQFTTHRTFEAEFNVLRKRDECAYDFILGRDLLQDLGIDILNSEQMFGWDGVFAPMVRSGSLRNQTKTKHEAFVAEDSIDNEPDPFEEIRRKTEVNLTKVVERHTHLNAELQTKLLVMLRAFPQLFGAGIGKYNKKKFGFTLRDGAKPYHGRAYSVPHSLRKDVKALIEEYVTAGILEPNPDSEWGFPSFVRPKKNGDLRLCTDFRKLNEKLVRKPFPLPLVRDLLSSIPSGVRYFTVLDLKMAYYQLRLRGSSKDMCMTVFPWGKYCYTGLPMGVSGSPDIFQQVAGDIFQDMETVLVYMDDYSLQRRVIRQSPRDSTRGTHQV